MLEEYLLADSAQEVKHTKRKNSTSYGTGKTTPKGSIYSGVVSVMKCAIGVGVLALPYLNTKVGLLSGLFFIVFGGIITYYCMIWNV